MFQSTHSVSATDYQQRNLLCHHKKPTDSHSNDGDGCRGNNQNISVKRSVDNRVQKAATKTPPQRGRKDSCQQADLMKRKMGHPWTFRQSADLAVEERWTTKPQTT